MLTNRRRSLKAAAGGLLQTPPLTGTRADEEREVAGIWLCWCPAGSFMMGAPLEEGGRPDEAPMRVTLTRGFWIGKYEVTQQDWRRAGGTNPDRPLEAKCGLGDDLPIYWINFAAAKDFCAKLTGAARRAQSITAGWVFAIPTEAQWEYACRAGTTTATAFGDRSAATRRISPASR